MHRARAKNLVIRLSDEERAMLFEVSARAEMSASEIIRWLVKQEFERATVAGVKKTKKARKP